MNNTYLIKLKNGIIYRVLNKNDESIFVINCSDKCMPKWVKLLEIESFEYLSEESLEKYLNFVCRDMSELNLSQQKVVYERFAIIFEIIPFVIDVKIRTKLIEKAAKENNLSKQTVRKYLCTYLIYQNITALAPEEKTKQKKILTVDEKNMRWALNKFFYSRNKNSLKTSYILLLKNKYCDTEGKLVPKYPSFYQFRYFYRKTKNMQTYYISRNGLSNYQRNIRPLTGDRVQTFVSGIGVGMLDSTVCDIYLVNEANQIVGRPVLTVCVDAYSSLCCGYSLSWEGGMYSIKNLMLNIISDKVEHCSKFGIVINKSDWNCNKLPNKFITDMGSEYKSENFEQLADLGVNITNLPPYRPDLKSVVEKFFDIVQNYYKPYLKGKGVVEKDYLERGVKDYRKNAALTLFEFEKIIIRCILFYNSKRILKNFPYTEDMLKENVEPYSNKIWEWNLKQSKTNLIDVKKELLIKTLLPRTKGKFTRYGLKVNGMYYFNDNFAEECLDKKVVIVAYNPDNVSNIWLIENGEYISFKLTESRFNDKSIAEVEKMKNSQKLMVKSYTYNTLQSEIELVNHILTIREQTDKTNNSKANIKNIRITRKKEKERFHKDFLKECDSDV